MPREDPRKDPQRELATALTSPHPAPAAPFQGQGAVGWLRQTERTSLTGELNSTDQQLLGPAPRAAACGPGALAAKLLATVEHATG